MSSRDRLKVLYEAVNQDDEMKDLYDQYLDAHISNVKKGFDWLYKHLPELFTDYDADELGSIIAAHDDSKYDTEEYYAYCEYFYGKGKKSKEVLEDFDYAWLHHQHHNPHHWQYWLLREDDGGTRALKMPYEYVIEMICDWWAFSWKEGNLYEIFNWYDNNTDKHLFHDDTKKTIEDILAKIRSKLDEANGNEK